MPLNEDSSTLHEQAGLLASKIVLQTFADCVACLRMSWPCFENEASFIKCYKKEAESKAKRAGLSIRPIKHTWYPSSRSMTARLKAGRSQNGLGARDLACLLASCPTKPPGVYVCKRVSEFVWVFQRASVRVLCVNERGCAGN